MRSVSKCFKVASRVISRALTRETKRRLPAWRPPRIKERVRSRDVGDIFWCGGVGRLRG